MRLLGLAVIIIGALACGSKSKPTNGTVNNTSTAKEKAKTPATDFKVEVVAGDNSVEAVLRDVTKNEPMVGATVVMSSPALTGEQVGITDEQGKVRISALPPGAYTLTVYYDDQTIKKELDLAQGKTVRVAVNWAYNPNQNQGQVITIDTKPVEYANAEAAWKAGSMYQTVIHGEKEIAKKPSSKLHAMIAIARYAAAIDTFNANLFGGSLDDKGPRAKKMKAAMTQLVADLDKVQASLEAAAKDPAFALELCVACMMVADGSDVRLPRALFEIERDRKGKELDEDDPRRRPTHRFDVGDLLWARAMVSFQQGLATITLAYDWNWIDELIAKLEAEDPDKQHMPKVIIKLTDATKVARAKELFLAGLDLSDQTRAAYLAETDDDREWVPNPKQKNYPVPIPIDAALYKTWESMVGDVRSLVKGDTGLSLPAMWKVFGLRRGAPTGFLDFGAMLASPKDIVFETGALDLIEGEKNPKKAAQMTTTFLQNLVGDGWKKTMKPSKITDRLLQIRKDHDKGVENAVEDKLKLLLWVN